MSDNLNKILGSILTGLLLLTFLKVMVHELYHAEALSSPSYVLLEGKASASAQVVKIELKPGDIDRGAKVFRKCLSCHSAKADGKALIGPPLWQIFDKAKGSYEGFRYSRALLAMGGVWDTESLHKFLQKPSRYIKGTKMTFAGLRKEQDIIDVIAYLQTLK